MAGLAFMDARVRAACERLIGLPFFQREFEVVQLRIRVAGIVVDCLFHARPIIGALLFRRETEIAHQVSRRLRRTHLAIAPHERFRLRVLSCLGQGVGEVKNEWWVRPERVEPPCAGSGWNRRDGRARDMPGPGGPGSGRYPAGAAAAASRSGTAASGLPCR